MSRGKAVRGSSNDDLEEGQQNPTIRYCRILSRLRLSVSVLVSLARVLYCTLA